LHGQQGIYGAFGFTPGPNPGPLTKIADLGTPIPEGAGNFTTFNPGAAVSLNPQPLPPKVSANNVVFWGGGSGGQQGIYGAFGVTPGPNPGPLIRIADLNTPIPGASGKSFTTFDPSAAVELNPQPLPPRVNGNNVVFWGAGPGALQGIYAAVVDPNNGATPVSPLVRIVDTAAPIPGGDGNFTGFGGLTAAFPTPGLSSGSLVSATAFVGLGSGGQQGIYVTPTFSISTSSPPGPVKLLDLNDTLDGKTITGLQLGPDALDGDPLAFTATFGDATQTICVIPVIVDLFITSLTLDGNNVDLGFTAPVGHNYVLQSTIDLANPAWAPESGSPFQGNGDIINVTNTLTIKQKFYRVLQVN
jgi:hypothetical protein